MTLCDVKFAKFAHEGAIGWPPLGWHMWIFARIHLAKPWPKTIHVIAIYPRKPIGCLRDGIGACRLFCFLQVSVDLEECTMEFQEPSTLS